MVVQGGEPPRSGLLFDTSVIIAAISKDELGLSRLRDLPADMLFVPAIVMGELDFGGFALRGMG